MVLSSRLVVLQPEDVQVVPVVAEPTRNSWECLRSFLRPSAFAGELCRLSKTSSRRWVLCQEVMPPPPCAGGICRPLPPYRRPDIPGGTEGSGDRCAGSPSGTNRRYNSVSWVRRKERMRCRQTVPVADTTQFLVEGLTGQRTGELGALGGRLVEEVISELKTVCPSMRAFISSGGK